MTRGDHDFDEFADPASWEDEGFVLPPAKNPRAVVSVPFALDEVALLERAVNASGLRLTEFIRQAALSRAASNEATPEPIPVRRPA